MSKERDVGLSVKNAFSALTSSESKVRNRNEKGLCKRIKERCEGLKT